MIFDKLKKISIKSTCCNKKVNIELNISHLDECDSEKQVKDLLFKTLDKKLNRKLSTQFENIEK